MSNSQTQNDERVKQMSKQEEILLNRKREIERKLKKQQPSQQNVRPLPYLKDEKPSSRNNKFNNDGSFFEQFKKLSNSSSASSAVKKESHNLPMPSIKQELKPTLGEAVQVPSIKQEQKSTISEAVKVQPSTISYKLPPCVQDVKTVCDVKKVPVENKYEPIVKKEIKNEPAVDPSQSDWFQDALKRAKEKAKEFGTPAHHPSVSLSEQRNQIEEKKRKSRWGEMSQNAPVVPPVIIPAVIPPAVTQQRSFNMPHSVMGMVGEGQHMEAIQGVMITKLTLDNPAINAYAMKVFGTVDLTEAQWKQCEEQMKMNIVFQLLQEKQKEAKRLEDEGRVKYEYDSDEDIDGGTWEHKRRKKEMELTAIKAVELTKGAEGKHHIGDFLPPEELAGFVEKYTALKEGRDPDLSDYREHRLTEDNIGYKMLKSMGWTEGTGLGAEGKGIMAPINQKGQTESQGLGAGVVNNLNMNDDEYDAYRKRMMLAYRFRPNPLNNPRRAYY